MPQPSTSLKGSNLKKKLVELACTTRPDKQVTIYVTSSTGHQIAEDGGGGVTGWREGRNQKLKSQFSGAGTLLGKKLQTDTTTTTTTASKGRNSTFVEDNTLKSAPATSTTHTTTTKEESPKPKQIFKNCTIYINGNTSLSGISDVELKRLLTSHGATVSYHLARRQVTHIILTNPSAAASHTKLQQSQSSSGTQTSKTTSSGLAILSSRKIELEMKGRVKSKMHYVSVEWALSSMKEGKRLAETKFPVVPLREARQGTLMDCKKVKASSQRSLMDMVKK
ncbi:hypothetical protein TWF694_009833 [Orbilia ellipsospora]|uniref:BRCT domain-containing protein n=1 Tax=Orbilia ellipsospora TaxID=2528407 RepID=A0AAV9XCE3_9PEZI